MTLLDEFRTIYQDRFPYRSAKDWKPSDDFVVLFALLEKKLAGKIDRLPSGVAEGAEPQTTARAKSAMEVLE